MDFISAIDNIFDQFRAKVGDKRYWEIIDNLNSFDKKDFEGDAYQAKREFRDTLTDQEYALANYWITKQ